MVKMISITDNIGFFIKMQMFFLLLHCLIFEKWNRLSRENCHFSSLPSLGYIVWQTCKHMNMATVTSPVKVSRFPQLFLKNFPLLKVF